MGARVSVGGERLRARVLALPGGNPAPLATLAWALGRQGVHVDALHAVLYASARRYLHEELLAGDAPLAQLGRACGHAPGVVEHLATLPDGAPVEDDADPAAAAALMATLWGAARALQQNPEPVVFALLSGRRRTLVADVVVAFQLLARPQDRLVEVRVHPRDAVDPLTRFYFPAQESVARVPVAHGSDVTCGADAVRVTLVDVRVPRLRHLLPPERLRRWEDALDAGEDALDAGERVVPAFDLRARTVRVGARTVTLSHDQAIWVAALAVARRTAADGWLDVTERTVTAAVHAAALRIWNLEPHELSDGWDFAADPHPQRLARLGPLRSRARRDLETQLHGHPWRDLVVPELRRAAGRSQERLRAEEVALCEALEAVVGAIGRAQPGPRT